MLACLPSRQRFHKLLESISAEYDSAILASGCLCDTGDVEGLDVSKAFGVGAGGGLLSRKLADEWMDLSQDSAPPPPPPQEPLPAQTLGLKATVKPGPFLRTCRPPSRLPTPLEEGRPLTEAPLPEIKVVPPRHGECAETEPPGDSQGDMELMPTYSSHTDSTSVWQTLAQSEMARVESGLMRVESDFEGWPQASMRKAESSRSGSDGDYGGIKAQYSGSNADTSLFQLDASESKPLGRGALFKAHNWAGKHRKQQKRKLYDWFVELDAERHDALGIAQVHDMVKRVLHEDALSKERIQAIFTGLRSGAGRDSRIQWDDGAEDIRRKSVNPKRAMTFDYFTDIVLWEGLSFHDKSVERDARMLRDVFIKQHIDKLVERHAHLRLGDDVNPWKQTTPVDFVDIMVAAVIIMNGIVIGISSDYDWHGFVVLEWFFGSFFILELVVKLRMRGICDLVRGPERNWNLLDIMVCMFAIVDFVCYQLSIRFMNFSIIRLARLLRITRLLRLLKLLRFPIFKELMRMISGVASGLRTLLWAIVLLFCLVYVVSVILRQTVGEDAVEVINDPYDTILFKSIPWSMYYVFRAFMSEDSLPNGQPLAGHMYELYGWAFVIPYAAIKVFIVFGIFNLITAIFVETVMEAARMRQHLTQEEERMRVAIMLRELVMTLMHIPNSKNQSGSSGQRRHSFFGSLHHDARSCQITEEFTRHDFQERLRDPTILALLGELNIHVGDTTELFDVLDGDGSGIIEIGEFIEGIMKMRSGETKNDVVAAVLGIRGIQRACRDIKQDNLQNREWIQAAKSSIEDLSMVYRDKEML